MRIAICFILLLLSFITFGKKPKDEQKFHWGIGLPFAVKFQLLNNEGSHYLPFGQGGVCVATVIDGKHEMALKFGSRIGLIRDNTEYRYLHSNTRFALEQLKVQINPEVIFPLGNERLAITTGFGIDWLIASGAAQTTTGKSYGFTTRDLEIVYDAARDIQRPVAPFINIGIRWHVAKGGYMQAFVRQNMMNDMPGSPNLALSSNQAYTLKLYHQPTYFGFCFYYYFR